ncbi:uncharacterized protein K02A2.6-like [Panicum hallii]|jgi:transposase InsO family protein|uniref:uncharacterized protein K02A2.6-like n=1 Tax=Panicum hallii TaxID=206008 RepID=UPI000DF4DFEA|nr:uncharacterized protein K02A2.6-like [Panicum hallii]
MPVHVLQTIPHTWPFVVWGLNMVGPLKKAPGGFTRLLIVVDKFTKWIEAKPIVKPSSQEAVKFFLNIVYRFGVPNTIITDNGSNFTGMKFLGFADRHEIKIDRASVGHPRTNGQVETMSRSSRESGLASSTSSTSLLAGRSRSSQPSSGD